MFQVNDALDKATLNKRVSQIALAEVNKKLGNKGGTPRFDLRVMNETATALGAGRCLYITGGELKEDEYLLKGEAFPSDWDDLSDDSDIVFLTSDARKDNGVATFVMSGMIKAFVTFDDDEHKYALPDQSGTRLTSTADKTRFRIVKNSALEDPDRLTLLHVTPKTDSSVTSVSIKNNSTATTPNLVVGNYIYINDATFVDTYTLGGKQPIKESEQRGIAFALTDTAQSEVGQFALWGSILAKVNITSPSHGYARIVVDTHELISTNSVTRFKIVNHETGESLTQLFVSPPNPYSTSVTITGAFSLVGTQQVFDAETVDGDAVYVLPNPSINPTFWDGLTIDGISYTNTSSAGVWKRDCDNGVDPVWEETLYPLWASGNDGKQIVGVLPNEFDTSTNREIPYIECGIGKVWAKTCV